MAGQPQKTVEAAKPTNGEPVAATTDPARPEPAADAPKRKGSRKVSPATLVLGVALVLVLIGAGIWQYNTQNKLDDARADLDKASTRAGASSDDLHKAKAALAHSKASLAHTKKALAHAQARVKATQAKLDGVQSSLTASERKVALQASQLTVLEDCLNGVSKAMELVAHGSYQASMATLHSVAGSCGRAKPLL